MNVSESHPVVFGGRVGSCEICVCASSCIFSEEVATLAVKKDVGHVLCARFSSFGVRRPGHVAIQIHRIMYLLRVYKPTNIENDI